VTSGPVALAVFNSGVPSHRGLVGAGLADFFDVFAGVNQVVIADVNGDGKPDLVGATAFGVDVALGLGDGSFTNPTLYPVQANAIALADMDGDGFLDVVAGGANQITVLYNGDGLGGFVGDFSRRTATASVV